MIHRTEEQIATEQATCHTPRIALIIPAYNEEVTIHQVIVEFHQACPSATIYVINNNSADDTCNIACKTLRESGAVGCVIDEPRQGKGNAVRTAFAMISADIYIMVDADLTYPASALYQLLQPAMDGTADLVVGDRQSSGAYLRENKRQFHNFGNAIVRWLINLLYGTSLHDIMSGYRVMTRRFVKMYPVMEDGFEIETEMTLHALDKKFRIKEIPVAYTDRPTGSVSKLSTYRDGILILRTIVWLCKDYKPLLFWSIVSTVFFVLGLVSGTPAVLEYIDTKYVSRVPLAILATGLVICSFVSLTVGWILDTVARFHRSDYQLRVNEYETS